MNSSITGDHNQCLEACPNAYPFYTNVNVTLNKKIAFVMYQCYETCPFREDSSVSVSTLSMSGQKGTVVPKFVTLDADGQRTCVAACNTAEMFFYSR